MIISLCAVFMVFYKELKQFFPGFLGRLGECYATLSSRSTTPLCSSHELCEAPERREDQTVRIGTFRKHFCLVNFTLKSVLCSPFFSSVKPDILIRKYFDIIL